MFRFGVYAMDVYSRWVVGVWKRWDAEKALMHSTLSC